MRCFTILIVCGWLLLTRGVTTSEKWVLENGFETEIACKLERADKIALFKSVAEWERDDKAWFAKRGMEVPKDQVPTDEERQRHKKHLSIWRLSVCVPSDLAIKLLGK